MHVFVIRGYMRSQENTDLCTNKIVRALSVVVLGKSQKKMGAGLFTMRFLAVVSNWAGPLKLPSIWLACEFEFPPAVDRNHEA